jgi:hypothetical protein
LKEYWRNEMLPLIGNQLAQLVDKADRGKREVCKFFLKGGCTFGEACRNLHVVDVADLDMGDAPERKAHTSSQDFPAKPGPSDLTHGPRRAPGAEANLQDCAWPSMSSRKGRAGPSPAGYIGQGRTSSSEVDDAECVICTDSIRKRGEKFGMLENCDHAFCLSCIRSWRKQKENQDRINLRMCPVCRNESFFVIPCDRLILNP